MAYILNVSKALLCDLSGTGGGKIRACAGGPSCTGSYFFMMHAPAFYVRDIPVFGDLILSPMDGFSDQPYRALCRSLGSAMSYTEFINALDVLQGHPHLWRKLAYLEQERPVVYQIFDNEPARLLEAALRLQERGPDIIDINMGCSVRCVSGRGAGAGLLREPEKVARIFSLLSRSLKVPVTAKIRLGWDEDNRNYCQIARIVEENGGALIAAHGRTRAQGYGGRADWEAIAEIKRSVSIPVIANGDVSRVADIERIKRETGCDGVMIGRAAIGNPWIFSRLDRADVSDALLHETMQSHLESMLDFYGPERGLVLFRKHASRYLAPLNLSADQRQRLLTASQPVEFVQTLISLNP
jgi:tRNA-dihydrouridine synthase B